MIKKNKIAKIELPEDIEWIYIKEAEVEENE